MPQVGARIMGFDDPTVKMSKSIAVERPGHAISLLDDPDTVRRVVMSAVTDSGRELRYEHASPGVRNLLTIAHVASGRPIADIEAELEGGGYGTLKKLVVQAVNDMLAPLQRRYREYMDDPASLDAVLRRGADRAREVAARTLRRAQDALGVG